MKSATNSHSLSALDIRFLVSELKDRLENGFVRKIYQYQKTEGYEFIFEIFSSGKGSFWLRIDNSKIFITQYKKSGQEPPGFCMLLRKLLQGKRITEISQHGFERIVEIKTGEYILIAELFSDGNVILCDSSYKIIRPLYPQEWKDRTIKPKLAYVYPPKKQNPFEFQELKSSISVSDKNLISFLVSSGFGPFYAPYICRKSGIREKTECRSINDEQMEKLYQSIRSILDESKKPCIYEKFISAFPLDSEPIKFTNTLSEAADEFFREPEVMLESSAKADRIENVRKKAVEKWSQVEKEAREIAEIMYKHYTFIESVSDTIRKAREKNISWPEIKKRFSESEYAKMVRDVNEKTGQAALLLDGKNVEIDFRKSAHENAAVYFEKAKKAKRKLEKVYESIESQKFSVKEKTVGITKMKRKWYEKFRWFFTSDGFLVIAGKDAETNEEVIKKHTESGDLVFHAEITGSSFAVIKSEGREITLTAKKEAAQFAAVYCKAWSKDLGSMDVYCIKPDQVSKTPPSGEHLGKGAFMIYGGREWYRNLEIRISLGIKIDMERKTVAVLVGPKSALAKNANYSVEIMPGNKKASDLAKMIKKLFIEKSKPDEKSLVEQVQIEEIQKWIQGTGEIA
jgi:predicted ribosome quality control (RQC) complex YloA/Tae2 family protein